MWLKEIVYLQPDLEETWMIYLFATQWVRKRFLQTGLDENYVLKNVMWLKEIVYLQPGLKESFSNPLCDK